MLCIIIFLMVLSFDALLTKCHAQEIPHIESGISTIPVKNITQNKDTSFKAFMDYRTITDTASRQYELQQQAYTDKQGLRKIDDYFCVALGTFYSKECGDKFEVLLDSGKTFKVIVADIKADEHTNFSNIYTPLKNKNGSFIYNEEDVQVVNMVEFIVDTEKLTELVKLSGDVSSLDFEGNILKIIKEV